MAPSVNFSGSDRYRAGITRLAEASDHPVSALEAGRLRIALIAPVWLPVPPVGYGGT
jgi:hypothetical protein